MTDPHGSNEPGTYERLLDLLAAEATEGLSDEHTEELRRLLGAHPEVDPEELQRAAAALDLALGGPPTQRLPAGLSDRLLEQARDHFAARPPVPTAARVSLLRRGALWAALGWVLAASLLVALWQSGRPAARQTAERRRAELLARADDVLTREWARPKEAEFASVRGDVVWSDARQEGYLRLRGMPANDARLTQYQLWIVDPARDRHPVDGGVFDVPAGSGEVVVPIEAKLRVRRPELFAITREQPGGVVVSKGPLLVVTQ